MKKPPYMITALTSAVLLGLLSGSVLADNIGRTPEADFDTGELRIPCVRVSNLSSDTEGLYFDIVLVRRGSSFNYELSAAEPEDTVLCERIGDFAVFEDDDFADDESDDDLDDDADDDSDDDLDDDSDDDSDNAGADMLVQCEIRSDRSKVSVKGDDLTSGDYYALVTSGGNSIESMVVSVTDDEFEVDFDSDPDDVLEGAEALEADFIVDASVSAEIYLDGTDTPVASAEATCRIK